MPLTWEEICSKLRTTFGPALDDEHAGKFLIQLHPIYRTACGVVALHHADEIGQDAYHRIISKLLGRPVARVIPVSITDPDRRPKYWNDVMPRSVPNYWNDTPLIYDVIWGFFSIELLNARCFTLRPSAEQCGGLPNDFHALDRFVNAYIKDALEKPLLSLWRIFLLEAITAALRTYLIASIARDGQTLADLEAFLPLALLAPPIGSPKAEPDTMLVLAH